MRSYKTAFRIKRFKTFFNAIKNEADLKRTFEMNCVLRGTVRKPAERRI